MNHPPSPLKMITSAFFSPITVIAHQTSGFSALTGFPFGKEIIFSHKWPIH